MLSNDCHHPSSTAIHLKGRLPAPFLIYSVISLPPLLYTLIGSLYIGRYGLVLLLSFLLGVWIILYTMNSGSSIAWDIQRIYERPSGFYFSRQFPWIRRARWRSLRFDEVARIEKVTVNDPAARSKLLPFQLLQFISVSGNKDDYIWIYSLAIRDEELAPLLHHIRSIYPGKLPKIVERQLDRWYPETI